MVLDCKIAAKRWKNLKKNPPLAVWRYRVGPGTILPQHLDCHDSRYCALVGRHRPTCRRCSLSVSPIKMLLHQKNSSQNSPLVQNSPPPVHVPKVWWCNPCSDFPQRTAQPPRKGETINLVLCFLWTLNYRIHAAPTIPLSRQPGIKTQGTWLMPKLQQETQLGILH